MVAAPTTGPPVTVRRQTAESSHRRLSRRDLPSDSWYEAELRRRWAAATGRDLRYRRQLEGMREFAIWTDLKGPEEPDGLVRTVGQFIDGPGQRLGWEHKGSAYEDHQAYRNRIANICDYLIACGWLADRSYVQEASGEGVGIMVIPGPCSSTGDGRGSCTDEGREGRETRPHVRAGRRRVRLLREVMAEHRGRLSGAPAFTPCRALDQPPTGAWSRAKAEERYTRTRAGVSAADRAALEEWWETARVEEPGAVELLRAVPGLSAAPLVALARAVFAVVHPGASPVISARQRERLEAAARRADRYADFGAGREGAGRELVLDLILGDWREYALERTADGRQRVPTPKYVPPKSLGGIAVCARRAANRWRRGDRARSRAS